MSEGSKPIPCAAYNKAGECIAVADSIHELASILGVTIQAVSHGLHRGSKRYGYIEEDEE